MRIEQCHMCGREQPEYALVDLLSSYKTREISKLCSDCEKHVNHHLNQLRLINHGWYCRMLRIWMRNNMRKFFKDRK